jgi:hypothetical protein
VPEREHVEPEHEHVEPESDVPAAGGGWWQDPRPAAAASAIDVPSAPDWSAPVVAQEPVSPWQNGESAPSWPAPGEPEEGPSDAGPWDRAGWSIGEPSPASSAVTTEGVPGDAESTAEAWAEPTDNGEAAAVDNATPLESDVASPNEGDRTGGWWAQTMGAAEPAKAPTDNEADRFLESVFSTLSDDDSAKGEKDSEDETGFGLGLLRRRRMGAAARDISDDDR